MYIHKYYLRNVVENPTLADPASNIIPKKLSEYLSCNGRLKAKIYYQFLLKTKIALNTILPAITLSIRNFINHTHNLCNEAQVMYVTSMLKRAFWPGNKEY